MVTPASNHKQQKESDGFFFSFFFQSGPWTSLAQDENSGDKVSELVSEQAS